MVEAPPDPWERFVSGDDLLFSIYDFLTRFIVVSEDEYVAISLWIVFTYLVAITDTSPMLALTSPVKRCGKTRLIEVLNALTRSPLATAGISPAAIYRTVDKFHPTMMID